MRRSAATTGSAASRPGRPRFTRSSWPFGCGYAALGNFTTEDLDDLCLLFIDPDVMRFSDGPQPDSWTAKWLQQQLDQSDGQNCLRPYAIAGRYTGRFVGYCGLFVFPNLNGRREIELGYRLLRNEWKKGYGKEAAAAILHVAFYQWHLPRLISIIDPNNIASIKIALSLGMQKESEVMLPGYDHPDHVYAIDRTDGTQQSAQPDVVSAG
jgi:RimJ/RimL family protein N-acetyltransferase